MGLDLEDLANPYVVITILKSIFDIFFRIYSYNFGAGHSFASGFITQFILLTRSKIANIKLEASEKQA